MPVFISPNIDLLRYPGACCTNDEYSYPRDNEFCKRLKIDYLLISLGLKPVILVEIAFINNVSDI